MVDERSVKAQCHEIQNIAHEIMIECISLDDQFLIVVITDNSPSDWKDFKKRYSP